MKSLFNKKKQLCICIITVVFLTMVVSCKKLIEINPPIDRITNLDAYGNNYNSNAVLLGIFNTINGFEFENSLCLSLSADELSYSGTFNLPVYTNDILSSNGPEVWKRGYAKIYMCNAAIEGVTMSSGISEAIKIRLTAEAKFIRALEYFYLVNLYGDIPLILSTNYQTNYLIGRTPTSQIYDQIIQDLKDAQNGLQAAYVGSDGLTLSSSRLRPNHYAASAILARVYIYRKDWANAEVLASEVIAQQGLYRLEPIERVFLTESKEAVWQLQPSDGSFNTEQARRFILTAPPTSDSFLLREGLVDAFESNDLRKKTWIGTYVDNSTTPATSYHYPSKYRALGKSPSEPFIEQVSVVRLAEMYLIRAEARAQLGKFTGTESCSSDINKIRNRANISEIQVDNLPNALLAIEAERRRELFSEWGHRWLDLKRTDRANAIMPAVTTNKGGFWQSTDQLYPVPLVDMENAPNLKPQNPGYL